MVARRHALKARIRDLNGFILCSFISGDNKQLNLS
jgi:hypothetical protein